MLARRDTDILPRSDEHFYPVIPVPSTFLLRPFGQVTMARPMRTADFDYHLPSELIAQTPAARRDRSRMMVLHRAGGQVEHRQFEDFPEYLDAGDALVLNNTKVIPARLHGRKEKTGGGVEVFLLEDLGGGNWDVLLRARRRPKPEDRLIFADGRAVVRLVEERELGRAIVSIESDGPVIELAEKFGEVPLPPYIRRGAEGAPGDSGADRERYQTIYAREHGAVAAPTAGLHFTPEIFQRLEKRGVRRAEVTLHVGLGTFRPVTAENVDDHRMEEERFTVSEEAAAIARAARRVVAVGSTTVRTLEHVAAARGRVEAMSGRSDLFIRPPFEFRVVGAMLTNFHLPKSTLLMMVSALAGREFVLRAYEEAVREKYRFFSYGDCMLIL